jgi:cob(I)alamin adenosyltransferase
MSDEEYMDVNLYLDADTASILKKKTKKELFNNMVVLILKTRIQQETIDRLEKEHGETESKLNNEKEVLQTKLDKAEAYVEQGRAMIESAMNRWYEYDA